VQTGSVRGEKNQSDGLKGNCMKNDIATNQNWVTENRRALLRRSNISIGKTFPRAGERKRAILMVCPSSRKGARAGGQTNETPKAEEQIKAANSGKKPLD